MGKHFTREIGELGFRLRCDFGIIHGAATSLSCLLSASRYSTENGGRLPLFFTAQTRHTNKWVNSSNIALLTDSEFMV